MLLESKEILDDNGEIGYYECVYNSDNILSGIYFPKIDTLYLSFNRGETYEYLNFTNEMFDEFQKEESQGKYLRKNVFNNKNIVYRKMFKLLPFEIEELKEKRKSIITENENNEEDED